MPACLPRRKKSGLKVRVVDLDRDKIRERVTRRKKNWLKVCVVEQSWTVKHAAEQYKIRRDGARRNEVGVNTVVQDKGERNEVTRKVGY